MRLLLALLIGLGLLQPFRPAEPYGPGHRGIDLSAPTFAVSPMAGTVVFAGRVAGTPTVSIASGATRVTLQPVIASAPVGW